MQLPKGLWFVSVLAVPGDLLRLVYVTRYILERVHCFDVCAILCHVSFAIGPQDFLSHHRVVRNLPLSRCCLGSKTPTKRTTSKHDAIYSTVIIGRASSNTSLRTKHSSRCHIQWYIVLGSAAPWGSLRNSSW